MYAHSIAFNNQILVAEEHQIVEVVDHIGAVDRTVPVAGHIEVAGVGHIEVVVVAAAAVVDHTGAAVHIVAEAARIGVVVRTAAEAVHTVVVADSLQGRRNYFPSFQTAQLIQPMHQAAGVVVANS